MLNPITFLKPSRLFQMQPGPLSGFAVAVLVIIFALLLISGAVCWWLKYKKSGDIFLNKFYDKMIALSFTIGIIGFVLLGFRQWQVYFFGARFLLLLWFIGFAIWLVYVIYYLIKIVPDKRETKDAEELFGKYLPKRKK